MLPDYKQSEKYQASSRAEAERLERQSCMDNLRARERAALKQQAVAAACMAEQQKQQDLLANNKKDKE